MYAQKRIKMRHFINLKDIPAKDLRKIISDAKKRKNLRKKNDRRFWPKSTRI